MALLPSDTTSAKTNAAEPGLPVFDPMVLAEVQELMDQKFTNVLRIYLDDTAHRLTTIGDLIASRGEVRDIVRHAHSIRSSGLSFGALRLAGLAEVLETIAADGKNGGCLDEKTGAVSVFAAMKQAFETVRPMLEKYLEMPVA